MGRWGGGGGIISNLQYGHQDDETQQLGKGLGGRGGGQGEDQTHNHVSGLIGKSLLWTASSLDPLLSLCLTV